MRGNDSNVETANPIFPIVGIGASAGGLDALKQLFGSLPADSGMAFVVIQHLDPERPSLLAGVLEGVTDLPVIEVTDGLNIEPNRVHVIPSDADLSIEGSHLKLAPRQLTGRLHLPIDAFFRSLAQQRQECAIGVVLTGSGADGTEGLRAIKGEGGFALVQDPASAAFRSMPESAIAAGVVDFLGTPALIGAELVRLARHPYVTSAIDHPVRTSDADQEKTLAALFGLLQKHGGIDFSGYKRTTVLRRIEKRMALGRASSLQDYAAILGAGTDAARGEAGDLAHDMLIHVTAFFRDPQAFDVLQTQVLRGLVARKGRADTVRIWVPGCSTGEEVYGLAMAVLECCVPEENAPSLKLFGTDLSDAVIESARLGHFSDAAVTGVTPERLARFFVRVEGGYDIAKRVRDLCVFVKHDLTRDPPFAKMDLISCRNVLIYFDVELQRKVIPMLHYCLNKQGHLFLGQSETITGFRDSFTPVDKESRIFTKTGDSPRRTYPLAATTDDDVVLSQSRLAVRRHPAREAQRQADHMLLARYAPAGVVINDRLEIIQFRGRTSPFLESPPGQPQANLLRMAHDDLAAHLHDAVERAKLQPGAVRVEGLRIRTGNTARTINLEVGPLALQDDAGERYFLILFEEQLGPTTLELAPPPTAAEPPADAVFEIRRVKAELVATKDYLQSVIYEHQMITDELASTNEEMVASNEEMQSTNEELQSAREELQSTNEELSTVNDQIRHRNQELDLVANDLFNVLSSVEIPMIIVDTELRMRRFTPTVSQIVSFIPEDVGRPIGDLKFRLHLDDIVARIRGVIDSGAAKDWDVEAQSGRWFRMQIRPYTTADHMPGGAVLAFVDVDVLKQARKEAENAGDYARSIVETVTTALVVLDAQLCVLSANAAFLTKFGVSADQVVTKSLFDLGPSAWQPAHIREALHTAMATHTRLSKLEFPSELPPGRQRVFRLTAGPIAGTVPMMLLAIEDVTELRALEAERARLLASEQEARIEAERANRAKDLFLATLSHELRTPLSTMLISVQLLKRLASEDPRVNRVSAAIERATRAQASLVDDLLDVSRIVSGKLSLDLRSTSLATVVRNAIDVATPAASAKELQLDVDIDEKLGPVFGDELRLQQVVSNLLVNAIKFTPKGGRIHVVLAQLGEQAVVSVSDDGIGIAASVLPHLFDRFVQAESSITRNYGGLGLGLSIVRHLVEAHGGIVQAESLGEGHGACFRVLLPLQALGELGSPQGGAGLTNQGGIEGVSVLLVDDDDDICEAYAAMLKVMGVQVRLASSAAAGLAALQTFLPQAILCDIAMPSEDGLAFIRKVRGLKHGQGGLVPAAALTALAGSSDKQQALDAGFQMHVAKPIDADQLAEVISTLIAWQPLNLAVPAVHAPL